MSSLISNTKLWNDYPVECGVEGERQCAESRGEGAWKNTCFIFLELYAVPDTAEEKEILKVKKNRRHKGVKYKNDNKVHSSRVEVVELLHRQVKVKDFLYYV